MEIIENYDPVEKKVLLNITTNLFNKYYTNFNGLIKLKLNNREIPINTEIKRLSNTEAQISFPLPNDSRIEKVDDTKLKVGINFNAIKSFFVTIDKFVISALKAEFSSVEFLPIDETDYSLENLKSDVKEAIKNKRNFVLLHTHKEFLEGSSISNYKSDNTKKKTIKYNQVYISYKDDASDYSNIALMILNGQMNELRKWANPRFKLTTWD